MSAAGETIVTWQDRHERLQTTVRPPNGRFSAPQTISDRGARSESFEVGSDGTAVAAWEQRVEGHWEIEAAIRSPGGTFGDPVTLSAAGGFDPVVAVNGYGSVVVAWETAGSARASIRPSGGFFSPPRAVPNSADSNAGLVVGIGDEGTIIVLVNGHSVNAMVKASFSRAGGDFNRAKRITRRGQEAEFAELAFDANGNATAIWNRFHHSHPGGVQAAYAPAGKTFGVPHLISGRHDGGELSLAVNDRGAAIAAWNGLQTRTRVKAAVRPERGPFGDPERVSPGISRFALVPPAVDIDSRGRAIAVWTKPKAHRLEGKGVFASERRPGQTADRE